jgi:glutaredoxin
MIVVYTQEGCGSCEILKNKLKEKKIAFSECNDIQILSDKLIRSVPIMEVDNKTYRYYDAINWVKNQSEGDVHSAY